jgi:hypothetical protein
MRRPGSFYVGFMMEKVALGQVFLQVIGLPCQYYSTMALDTHMASGE